MIRARFVIALLCFVCCLGTSTFAQPLADRVPADAIVYVGWRGAENMPGYSESHLKAILDQSNVAAVFNEMVPQLIQRAAQQNAQAGAALNAITGIGSPLWKHPTAFFFAGMDFTKPQPVPRLGILCKAG